jgi:hypothetical protein
MFLEITDLDAVAHCHRDDKSEVGQRQQSSSNKLHQLAVTGAQLQKADKAAKDENEMAEAADSHGDRDWLAGVARAEKRPELFGPGLNQVSEKQIHAVPCGRHDGPDAEPPGAVAPGEQENRNIDQGLQRVQKAKAWLKDG